MARSRSMSSSRACPSRCRSPSTTRFDRLNDLAHAAPHLPFPHSSQDPEPSRVRQGPFVNIPHLGVDVEWMSGGKRQMIACAKGMAFESRILILDEPTAALGVPEANSLFRRSNSSRDLIHGTSRRPTACATRVPIRPLRRAGEDPRSRVVRRKLLQMPTNGMEPAYRTSSFARGE